MQITARLFQMLPVETGTGRNGEWKKQNFVLESDGQYPRKICFSLWGDKIDTSRFQIGDMLTVDFDLESREYNGRWYNDIKAWKVEVAEQNSAGASAPEAAVSFGIAPPPPPFPENEKDDLPF